MFNVELDWELFVGGAWRNDVFERICGANHAQKSPKGKYALLSLEYRLKVLAQIVG
jgi:hypothetical protein